jgi:hypothetical protein
MEKNPVRNDPVPKPKNPKESHTSEGVAFSPIALEPLFHAS